MGQGNIFFHPHFLALLWMAVSWPSSVHALISLNNKDIFCHFYSLLVNSGHFKFTSTTSAKNYSQKCHNNTTKLCGTRKVST